jgi:hypothetical protein
VGIEQVQRLHRRDRTVERSMEKILCQEGVEKVCKQAQENRELFEFYHLKGESKEGSSQGY